MNGNDTLRATASAIRDVGFPIVMCLILVYAIVWGVPTQVDRLIHRLDNLSGEVRIYHMEVIRQR